MIKAISESLNIENIKLDFNEIGPTFIERLCNVMIANTVDLAYLSKNKSSGQISNLSGLDEDSNISMLSNLGGNT